MEKLLKLEITSPEKIVYAGSVKSVTAPTILGESQILFNHANLVSILGIGRVIINDENDNIIKYAASGGIIEVKNNCISILAEDIERSDEINIEKENEVLSQALDELKSFKSDKDKVFEIIDKEKNKIKIAK